MRKQRFPQFDFSLLPILFANIQVQGEEFRLAAPSCVAVAGFDVALDFHGVTPLNVNGSRE